MLPIAEASPSAPEEGDRGPSGAQQLDWRRRCVLDGSIDIIEPAGDGAPCRRHRGAAKGATCRRTEGGLEDRERALSTSDCALPVVPAEHEGVGQEGLDGRDPGGIVDLGVR